MKFKYFISLLTIRNDTYNHIGMYNYTNIILERLQDDFYWI